MKSQEDGMEEMKCKEWRKKEKKEFKTFKCSSITNEVEKEIFKREIFFLSPLSFSETFSLPSQTMKWIERIEFKRDVMWKKERWEWWWKEEMKCLLSSFPSQSAKRFQRSSSKFEVRICLQNVEINQNIQEMENLGTILHEFDAILYTVKVKERRWKEGEHHKW